MAEHFAVQFVPQTGQRSHHGFRVGVLGFEIGGDVGIFLVAQPGVVVDEGDAMHRGFFVVLAGDRGL